MLGYCVVKAFNASPTVVPKLSGNGLLYLPPDQCACYIESKLDARMRANISVLHSGVSVPMSCVSFSTIPPIYLEWYRAVFEDGKRLPPPASVQSVLTVQLPVTTTSIAGSGCRPVTPGMIGSARSSLR